MNVFIKCFLIRSFSLHFRTHTHNNHWTSRTKAVKHACYVSHRIHNEDVMKYPSLLSFVRNDSDWTQKISKEGENAIKTAKNIMLTEM